MRVAVATAVGRFRAGPILRSFPVHCPVFTHALNDKETPRRRRKRFFQALHRWRCTLLASLALVWLVACSPPPVLLTCCVCWRPALTAPACCTVWGHPLHFLKV